MDEDLHEKQVEAYYTLLCRNPGRSIKVPIPLKGQPIPSKEDYDNSYLIWKKVEEILLMMGIKHTSYSNSLTIRIEK